MSEKIELSIPNKTFNSEFIDALLLIRVKLSTYKIMSDVIKKSEFNLMLQETKEKVKNMEVSNAIDELFKDELTVKKENSFLSLDEMQKRLDNELYQDKGENKGPVLIKNNEHFSSGQNTEAA